MHTYIPTDKKLKSLGEKFKRSTPHRDLKSFRSHGRQREMGVLSAPSAHMTINIYICKNLKS